MNAANTLSAGWVIRRSAGVRAIGILAVAGALAASAKAQVPIGPVPITAQTLIALLAGALLGPADGAAGVLVYLAAGTAQPALFANPQGLAGPTGGYLVGFAAAAVIGGSLLARGWGRSPTRMLAALLAADAALFACGLLWLATFPLPVPLLWAGLWPFLPGEAVKIAIAGVVLTAVRR